MNAICNVCSGTGERLAQPTDLGQAPKICLRCMGSGQLPAPLPAPVPDPRLLTTLLAQHTPAREGSVLTGYCTGAMCRWAAPPRIWENGLDAFHYAFAEHQTQLLHEAIQHEVKDATGVYRRGWLRALAVRVTSLHTDPKQTPGAAVVARWLYQQGAETIPEDWK